MYHALRLKTGTSKTFLKRHGTYEMFQEMKLGFHARALVERYETSEFFMVSCYYLVNFGCFVCMNMIFYIFFGTNLLTQCQVSVSVFSCFDLFQRRILNGVQME